MNNQNFISVDGKTARNSYGDFFNVGDVVEHQDNEAGTATILSFEPSVEKNEVWANTDKGYAFIDFISKIS